MQFQATVPCVWYCPKWTILARELSMIIEALPKLFFQNNFKAE